MSNYVNVQGDLYNKYMCINSVSRVRYQRHADNWVFIIYLTDEGPRNNWTHKFDTEYEAEAYRREFVAKVLDQ